LTIPGVEDITRGDPTIDAADGTAQSARLRAALFLTAALLAAYAYFYQAGGWNQNTRFALVRAIVEHGTISIDETFQWRGRDITGDVARRDGHTYSDKPPGVALTAVPVVGLARLIVGPADNEARIALLSYLATVAVAAIPTALAAFLLFRVATMLGASAGGALFAAATFGFGTPAWCYATLFYGHSLANGCLVLAFASAVALRESGSATRDRLLGAGVGLGAGWAVLSDYTTPVPAVIIAMLALANMWSNSEERQLRVVEGLGVTAAACCVVLMLYNAAAFGSPLEIGYRFEQGFEGMQQGLMGVTYPKLFPLTGILVGRFRGLLLLSPILALAPLGFVALVRTPTSRWPAIAAATIAVYYVFFNASYHYWSGGWSYGPRIMSAALPFLCLALAPLWSRAPRIGRVVMAILALYGAVLAFIAVAVTAQPSTDYGRPVKELYLPSFQRGELSLNHQSFVEMNQVKVRDPVTHAWNLGERMGLSGKTSLVPLLGVWAALGVGWVIGRRREE
jgi:hypothetical protein